MHTSLYMDPMYICFKMKKVITCTNICFCICFFFFLRKKFQFAIFTQRILYRCRSLFSHKYLCVCRCAHLFVRLLKYSKSMKLPLFFPFILGPSVSVFNRTTLITDCRILLQQEKDFVPILHVLSFLMTVGLDILIQNCARIKTN